MGREFAIILGLACQVSLANAQEVCLRDTDWGEKIAPHSQRMEFELIEQTGPVSIVGIEFSPLVGEFAKLYGFFRHNGDCVVRAFVVGAFASANGNTLVEEVSSDKIALFNQDYYSDETHVTIAVSDTPPSYDEAREKALELLR